MSYEEGAVTIIEPSRPSFSIIVPTFGEHESLARTLGCLVWQRPEVANVEREIWVIGDGFEEQAQKVVNIMQAHAKEQKQNVSIGYAHLKAHLGNGNIARARGLKQATKDWVVFIDNGTMVTHDFLSALTNAMEKVPAAQFIMYDIVQLLDPVPVVTSVHILEQADRSKGLPYVIPGNAACIKREYAQAIEWPNVSASDWAYYSLLWKHMFGLPEDEEKIQSEVVLIPNVLGVAYAARTQRKLRYPATKEQYFAAGYDQPWEAARDTLVIPPPSKEPDAVTNTESVPRAD